MAQPHRIVARFSDGVERAFDSYDDDHLLSTALAAGIDLLHQCRAGSCGTCICQQVSGVLEMDRSTSLALLPTEQLQGKFLACVTRARSDAMIEFSYSSDWLERERPRRYLAKVLDVSRIGETASQLQIELDDPDEPAFTSGMYFLLRVPDTEQWRAYSPATTSHELPELTFLIRHMRSGLMTDYLLEHGQAGDDIEIEGPFGEFFLRDEAAPLIMIAGGTGLAPILSILDDLRERRRHRQKILLCFGVTRYEDLFYCDELELRQHWMRQLEVRMSIAVPDSRWQGSVGLVTELLTAADGSAAHQALVCGPPSMVEAAQMRLTEIGVPRDAIFHERFAPSGGRAANLGEI